MKIKQEILNELRKRTPLAEVKRKFRSKSMTYEALTEYLSETEKIVDEKQATLREVKAQLLSADAELQRVCEDKDKSSAEVVKLQKARESLTAEVNLATERRDRLAVEVRDLEAKGYSPAVIKELKTVDARSGPGLLSEVKTAEKRKQMKKEVFGLETRKTGLEGEVKALETKKKSMEHSTVSEKNVLDELKLQTTTFKKAMVEVESLLKSGYTVEDVRSLGHGLDVLGIKSDPAASVTRLVHGLAKQKSIVAVEERLRKKREELDEVNGGLAIAKGKLAAIEQATLKTIQEGQKASEQAIVSIRDLSTQAIADSKKRAEAGIDRTVAKIEARAEETVEKTAEKLEARTNESVGKFETQTQQTADRYKDELKQTLELEKRRAEVEMVLGPGLPLVDMLKSREGLKKVPPPYVMQLLERIQAWFEMNLPTTAIEPPEYIYAKEHSFSTVRHYKLSALVELAKEGLKQRTNGQQKT